MTDISIRKHIRWLPDEASEPTSTIVLTSPERRFVDLRILLDQKPSPDGTLPLSALEWAIAGTSSSKIIQHSEDGDISHSQWKHWIDSRTPNTDNVADEGDMYPQPDGSTLEKGHMVNPATGLDTEYEEVWVSEEIQAVPAFTSGGELADVRVCVVLEMRRDEEGRRGMVVRLGQYCQGFARTGGGEGDVAVERWRWEGEEGWVRGVRIGEGEMPCDFAMHLAAEAVKGDVVSVGGDVWMVVEREGV
ncbi:hypothetical protein B0T16DRAFT_328245 [Cercophora newfieldiana]|uniref:Protein HRI1 n=1 Tax=Cercophora newfieldiana TaxID=92897 RepID=A0AA39Y6F0_9PEZI|nr:hypothetical protein B0T16DRAFT_328245 [Cercophora newfieldiana]